MVEGKPLKSKTKHIKESHDELSSELRSIVQAGPSTSGWSATPPELDPGGVVTMWRAANG